MAQKLHLVDPGAMLSTTHELRDGARMRLRLTRPSDRPLIESFVERLSPETRELRFGDRHASERAVRELTFYDPRSRLVAAAAMPIDGVEAIVGIADVSLLNTGLAELGIVVDDVNQGRGVGALLAEAVAALAYQRGATRVKAVIRGDNTPMSSLLSGLGPTVYVREDDATVAYTRLLRSDRHAA